MKSRPRLIFSGLVVAVVLAIAACGGGSSTSAPTAKTPAAPTSAPASAGAGGGQAGTVDANTILTSDAAASIIGGSPKKLPAAGGQAGQGLSIASYSNGNGDNVTALVEPVPAGVGATMLQAAIQAAGSKGDLQTLTGLGDAAGKVSGDHEATVAFVKGDTLVVVFASAANANGSDLEPKLETLARQIADKL